MRALAFSLLLIPAVAAAAAEPLTWRTSADAARLEAQLTTADVAALIDELTADLHLANADYSGRGFYNRLFVIKGGGNPRYQIVDGWDLSDLAGRIADFDGDGRAELLVTRLLTPYGGGYPQATYRAVYELQNGRWRDASASFAAWYRQQELPRIEQELNERRAVASPAELDQALADAAELERDKVLRVIGSDREAGLAAAAAWSADGHPYRRIYAATILADIGTPAAQERLKLLQADPDPHVAQAARAAHRK
jgi:hypothetical protein